MLDSMTAEILAVVGLLLGATLYALLVRRRAGERFDILSMSRALTTSNEIALSRIRNRARDRAGVPEALEDPAADEMIVRDRRSGSDRRSGGQRSRGRGRRAGGERRRGYRT